MNEIEQALNRAMFAIAQDLRNELQDVAPVKTGILKGTIEVTVTPDGLMITMPEYGKFVEFGTAPHVIQARKKKSLKWKGGDGKAIFAKRVNHPGTRPNPFIRSTLHQKLGRIITKRLQEEL